VVELLLKLVVHRLYFFVGVDVRWNLFDLALVILGVIDMFIPNQQVSFNPSWMRILRVIRVTKAFRMLRLMKSFSELRLLLKCIAGSFGALMWSLLMLLGITVLFSLIIVNQLTGFLGSAEVAAISGQERKDLVKTFGSVERAVLSMTKAISGGNDLDYYYSMLMLTGSFAPAVLLVYILFTWLSMANVITSLYVDKAMKLVQPDLDEKLIDKRKEDIESACELRRLFSRVDTNNSGSISYDEFMACMNDYHFRSAFEMQGLACQDAHAFFRILAGTSANPQVDIDAFVGGCMKLKGLARNIDLLSLHLDVTAFYRSQRESSDQRLQQVDTTLDSLVPASKSGIQYNLTKLSL